MIGKFSFNKETIKKNVFTMFVVFSMSGCSMLSEDIDSAVWFEDENETVVAVDSHSDSTEENVVKEEVKKTEEVIDKEVNKELARKPKQKPVRGLIADKDIAYDEKSGREEVKTLRPYETAEKDLPPVPSSQPVKDVDISELEKAKEIKKVVSVDPVIPVVEKKIATVSAASEVSEPSELQKTAMTTEEDVVPSFSVDAEKLEDTASYDDIATTLDSLESNNIAEAYEDDAEISFLVTTVLFPHGSKKMTSKSKEALKEVVELQKLHEGVIRVIGHASSRTRDMEHVDHIMANFNVSMERARTVCSVLENMGVSAENLYFDAVSDNEPIYYESMPAGEAMNRRADVYLDY